ncbi:hypothetical protein HAX54_004994, partial [Datura stramonium]|nr:hypothetical protein [Datura stramonium]
TMTSKGNEVVLADPSLKRTRKYKKRASSSASKVGPLRRLVQKQYSLMGLLGSTLKKMLSMHLRIGYTRAI